MVHMEEGTERNLHSGHMVYMTALMEVGVGAGLRTGGSASQGHHVWSRQEGEGL